VCASKTYSRGLSVGNLYPSKFVPFERVVKSRAHSVVGLQAPSSASCVQCKSAYYPLVCRSASGAKMHSLLGQTRGKARR